MVKTANYEFTLFITLLYTFYLCVLILGSCICNITNAGINGKNANQDNGVTTQKQINQASAIIKRSNLLTRLKSMQSPIANKGKPKHNEPNKTINGCGASI